MELSSRGAAVWSCNSSKVGGSGRMGNSASSRSVLPAPEQSDLV